MLQNLVDVSKCSNFAMLIKSRYMKPLKVIELIRMLQKDGWYIDRQRGSHRQFKHITKKGTVTVNGKDSVTLTQELLNSIFKQAGWK